MSRSTHRQPKDAATMCPGCTVLGETVQSLSRFCSWRLSEPDRPCPCRPEPHLDPPSMTRSLSGGVDILGRGSRRA
jgi:hypothetical protein